MTGKPVQVASPQAPATAPPVSIDPNAHAAVPPQTAPVKQIDKDTTWKNLVGMAITESNRQNAGNARTNRVCQPELKSCSLAIFFKGKDDIEVMVRRTEDINGKLIAREFCTFNSYHDIRECLNWDTEVLIREMKNAKGDWIAVDGGPYQPSH